MVSRPSAAGGLRVALVTRSIYPAHGIGGLERSTHDLVRHLLPHGVRVHIVTRPGNTTAAAESLPSPQVTWHLVPYRTFPLAGRRGTTILDRSTAYPLFGYRAGRVAARLAQAGDVDIVLANGASGLGYALARGRSPADTRPLVLNPHGLEEFGGPDASFGGQRAKRLAYGLLRAAVRRTAASADCVIATDRALAPSISHHLRIAEGRIRLVPNAVDIPRCDALASNAEGVRLRLASGVSAETPVLLSVGRLEANKGLDVLADALATIRDLPWHWVVVGDGPYRPRLASRIDAAGIGARTRLCGRVEDATLHAWYEAASIFVHPTRYEGSSIVTLEAMTHRLPVVATTAGGLPDKVQPGDTGWLVPPGDGAALAAALRTALESGPKLATMGLAGRARVEAEFSWTRSAARLMAVFAEFTD